ncbi:MAG: hypothetical protein RIG66_01315 [Coleofasciculus sp. E2-BRE-01]
MAKVTSTVLKERVGKQFPTRLKRGLGLTKQILDHNQDNPSDKIKFPTGIDLHKWLVDGTLLNNNSFAIAPPN